MKAVAVAALSAVLAASCSSARPALGTKAAAVPPPRRGPHFQRAVVVVFENHERSEIAGNAAAPTFNAYAKRYAALAGYRAVAHPSLPNYLALVSGSTQGVTDDCTDCTSDAPNLADTFTRARLSWKTYAEGLPSPGFVGAESGRYAKKHNPFVYFTSVLARPARLRSVVPYSQFRIDLRARRLPRFSLVIPDLCNDMHDCPVATGDAWLAPLLRLLLRSPQLRHGVVFVVFDEGSSNVGGGGRVFAFAAGGAVRQHVLYRPTVTHYGLLATLEANWGLPRLGRSASAKPIAGIWW